MYLICVVYANLETGNGKEDNMEYNKITTKVLSGCSKSLKGAWRKASKGQKIYQGVNTRLLSTAKHIEFLKGLNIIDIGSNQGLLSCLASRYCPRVRGIEVNKGAFKRSLKTREWMLNNGHNVNHVSFERSELSEYEDIDEVNGILASCVIYNMDDKNIEKFFSLLPQCERVLYQTRPGSMDRIEGRSKYDVCLVEDVYTMFEDRGYKVVKTDALKTRWPVILAEKI